MARTVYPPLRQTYAHAQTPHDRPAIHWHAEASDSQPNRWWQIGLCSDCDPQRIWSLRPIPALFEFRPQSADKPWRSVGEKKHNPSSHRKEPAADRDWQRLPAENSPLEAMWFYRFDALPQQTQRDAKPILAEQFDWPNAESQLVTSQSGQK